MKVKIHNYPHADTYEHHNCTSSRILTPMSCRHTTYLSCKREVRLANTQRG